MAVLAEAKRHLIEQWRSAGADPKLLKAFHRVPREEFVPENLRDQAYIDQPLHIGHGQTISQPTTIMNMLNLLEVTASSSSKPLKILEIGSGSGYVCALLAELGCKVTGVEIIPELTVRSSRTLGKLGYGDKIAIYASDGGGGWEEDAPFDRILISAACPEVPRHLFWQIKKGGILVAPVGAVEQRMIVCRKKSEKDIVEEDQGGYIFVPLVGKYGKDGEMDVPNLPFV